MTKNEFVTSAIRDGKTFAEAVADWKKSEHYRKREGSRTDFYDFLREAPRTTEEVDEWFASNASENMRRNKANFDRIAELVRDVRGAKTAAKKAA